MEYIQITLSLGGQFNVQGQLSKIVVWQACTLSPQESMAHFCLTASEDYTTSYREVGQVIGCIISKRKHTRSLEEMVVVPGEVVIDIEILENMVCWESFQRHHIYVLDISTPK